MNTLWLVAALTVSVSPAPPAECRDDAECAVTDFAGCCGSCCPQTYATNRANLEASRQRCAAVDCAAKACDPTPCAPDAPPSEYVAVCRSGRCQKERKGREEAPPPHPPHPPPAECRVDAECTVTWTPGPFDPCRTSQCGCCPVEPRAVVAERQRTEPGKPSPKSPPGEEPTPAFGLSQPRPQAPRPPQVNCAACPAPMPGTAVCRGGRCVLAPQARPLTR